MKDDEKTVLIKAEVIKTARSEMGLDNHALVKIDTATAEEKMFYVPKELIIDTDDIVSRKGLLEEYDRQHVGPPGGARKIIEKAPSAIAGKKADSQSIYLEETETRIDVTINALEYIASCLRGYKAITETGGCNECADRKTCSKRPKWGQIVRFNCMFFKRENNE